MSSQHHLVSSVLAYRCPRIPALLRRPRWHAAAHVDADSMLPLGLTSVTEIAAPVAVTFCCANHDSGTASTDPTSPNLTVCSQLARRLFVDSRRACCHRKVSQLLSPSAVTNPPCASPLDTTKSSVDPRRWTR